MSAPVGNEFWKARSSHGRKPIFASPDDLMTACLEYFEWVEANPLYEVKGFAFQGVVTKETFPKMRAMSIGGLCIFLDIARPTWDEYRKNKDFTVVCGQVEETIRAQKFEGASADLLNPAIIARDLGLADRSEVTGKDGGPIETKEVSDNEMARRIAFMLAKGLQAKQNEPE
ncbi:terminase small subunit [Neorhizobium sp. IRAMC:178]|uniref:terminase small subunit n=1 Tax=Neorhizobium tunisiense TaxID=3144793 RepID=UPI0031F669F5